VTVRTWSRLFWHSFGAAAVVAAAQWGIGYGLGLVDWGQPFEAGNENAWNSLLTWTAFISAVSVLGGAAAGGPGIRRPGHRVTLNARLSSAIAAGLGAATALPVAWLPGRIAHPPTSAGFTVTTAAAAGIVVGVLFAVLALSLPTISTSLAATVAWAWLVALGCCAVAIVQGEPVNHIRLGVIDARGLVPDNAWWLGPELMIGLAVLLGAATASIARRRGANWYGIIASGVTGPALIAAMYGIGGPGVSGDHRDQFQPYLAALLGAGAALLAAILVVMLRPRRRAAGTPAADSSGEATSSPGGSGSAGKATAGKAAAGKATAGKAAAGKAGAAKTAAAGTTAAEDATEPGSTKRGKAPARSATAKPLPAAIPAAKPSTIVTTTLSVDDLEVSVKPVKRTRATKAAPAPARAAAAHDEVEPSELDLPARRPASSASTAAATPVAKPSGRSRARSGRSGSSEPAAPSLATPSPATPSPAIPSVAASKPAKPLSKRAARKEEAARKERERRDEAARLVAARREAAQEAARQEAARKAAAKARRKAPTKRGAVANARRDRLRRSDLDHIDWVRELVHGADEPEPAAQNDR
jgi:hypothetical protein